MDGGGFQHGAIDGGVGAHFDFVLDDHVAQLWDLAVGPVFGCEPEAVRADDGACMQDAAGSDDAAVVDGDVRIDDRVVTDLDIVADVSVRIDAAATADDAMLTDVSEVPHIAARAHPGRRGDEGRGVDTLFLRLGLFHKVEQRGQRGVGVRHTQQGGLYGRRGMEVIVDQNDGCLRAIYIMFVFGVGKEGEGTRFPFLDL